MKKTILGLAAVIAITLSSGATAAYIVHTSDIANGAVTHAKLSKNSVWNPNIGIGSVQNQNLNSATQSRLALWFNAYQTGAIYASGTSNIRQVPGTTDYTFSSVEALDDCAIIATTANGEPIGAQPSSDPNTPNQLDITFPNAPENFSVAVFCNVKDSGIGS